jgi:hypothetical protein
MSRAFDTPQYGALQGILSQSPLADLATIDKMKGFIHPTLVAGMIVT